MDGISGVEAINLVLEDGFEFHDSVKLVVKAPALGSRGKKRREVFTGAEQRKSTGAWVDKKRVIDRDHDLYHERVKDEATGEIIHEVTEPLSSHIGHGSAKPKRSR